MIRRTPIGIEGYTEWMTVYLDYVRAEALRNAIDAALARVAPGPRRDGMAALRGQGAAGAGDVQYGSITTVTNDEETVVGLQSKLLFMLELLQTADARPTSQAVDAVRRLGDVLPELERRWSAMN